MRILSITAQKPDSTGSGVYLTELVKGFDMLGHKQAVIAGIVKDDKVRLPRNVEVYPVYFESDELPFPVVGMSDEMPYRSTRYSDMTEKMTERFILTFRKQIRDVVKEFRPDIILSHHLYFLTSMVREICPDIPVYGICHGSDMRQNSKNVWQRSYIRSQIGRLDGIFALHREQKEEICEWFACPGELVTVVGTGYNNDIFKINEARQKQKNEEELRLIFAGKISEKKGVESLIRALDTLTDMDKRVCLVLAGGYGNEAEFARIQQLASQCACRVNFLGRLAQRELAAEMNRSDIFVLPSFYEGLPLVVIEALACGLRVVCTDLPGIQSWLAENLPQNEVVFVKPPKMVNADEPLRDELPDFEQRLAQGIRKAEKAGCLDPKSLERLSWEGVCRRILGLIF